MHGHGNPAIFQIHLFTFIAWNQIYAEILNMAKNYLMALKILNRKVETIHYNGSLHVWRVVNK
jgi:hypothetical protein